MNKIKPIIFKKVIDKNAAIRFAGIDTNKHIKENLRSFIKFFNFPAILLPPIPFINLINIIQKCFPINE